LAEVSATVRRIVLYRWGRVDDLDDLVQDVLLSLHSVRHTYAPDRPFVPWLLAIVRNRMADAARRHARRTANEITVEFLPETFSDDQTNYSGNEFGDPELLRQAIADLPAGQRQAVELLKLGEMSLKEASVASGQSVAALKVAMHRALKALKAAIGREKTE
jgi:RNA polymerase sigma-70 factor (ECF subfamily)